MWVRVGVLFNVMYLFTFLEIVIIYLFIYLFIYFLSFFLGGGCKIIHLIFTKVYCPHVVVFLLFLHLFLSLF